MPMIAMPGMPELIIIALVVFLLFGAKKLPALGGAIGESIKNFKKGVDENAKLDPKDESKSDSDSNNASNS